MLIFDEARYGGVAPELEWAHDLCRRAGRERLASPCQPALEQSRELLAASPFPRLPARLRLGGRGVGSSEWSRRGGKSGVMGPRPVVHGIVLVLAVLLGVGGSAPARPVGGVSPVRHVFVIVLENASYARSFGPNSRLPYLARTLPGQGVLLDQYYGTAHYSLGNYLAIVGGVAPNPDIQMDCPAYTDMVRPSAEGSGQIKSGSGCIFPPSVPTLTGQLAARHLTWRGYMEDMGNVPGREEASCGKPSLGPGAADLTQEAAAGDAYTARHNPFLYFASLAETGACAANVVPLVQLSRDLETVSTTPNLSFISANLCNDGHDQICAGVAASPAAEDAWLRTWVSLIMASAAYQQSGAIIIVNDEADADTSACCNEPSGPNVTAPGLPPSAAKDGTFAAGPGNGQGGGRVGAIILSPFVRQGTTSSTPYNHYSLLKSIEDVFALPYLGYAGTPGLVGFGSDIWSRSTAGAPDFSERPAISPGASPPPPGGQATG